MAALRREAGHSSDEWKGLPQTSGVTSRRLRTFIEEAKAYFGCGLVLGKHLAGESRNLEGDRLAGVTSTESALLLSPTEVEQAKTESRSGHA